MSARAIWKGELQLAKWRLPVKLFAAVEDRTVRFHLLHDQDMVRIRQRMANPITDETVSRDEMQKGYEVDRGQFIVLDERELESFEPAASRAITVEQFLSPSSIHHQWYDRPYWLGADGDSEAYFAFSEALAAEKAVALVRWVMRKKRYAGVLRSEEGYLALITLRHAESIVAASDLEPPTGRQLENQERKLARQLIRALQADFEPTEFQDHYAERLRQLIETKREGGTVTVEQPEAKPRYPSLVDSLRASLQSAK